MKYQQILSHLYPPVSYDVNGEAFLAQCEVDGKVFEELEQSAVSVLNVVSPETSGAMLSDWERVCGIKTEMNKPNEERIKRVILKLNETGGLFIPYFIRLAQSIGYSIEVKEFSPLEEDYPDQRAILQYKADKEGQIFVWRITVVNGDDNLIYFRAGESYAGDRLCDFGDPFIEDFFNELKPAHTYCYFAYRDE